MIQDIFVREVHLPIPDLEVGRQAHHRPAVGSPLKREVLFPGRHVPPDASDGSGVEKPVLRRVASRRRPRSQRTLLLGG